MSKHLLHGLIATCIVLPLLDFLVNCVEDFNKEKTHYFHDEDLNVTVRNTKKAQRNKACDDNPLINGEFLQTSKTTKKKRDKSNESGKRIYLWGSIQKHKP